MSRKTSTIFLFSIATLAGGCEKEQTAPEQIEQVKVETQIAPQRTNNQVSGQKIAFSKITARSTNDNGLSQPAEFAEKNNGPGDAINQTLTQIGR